MKRIVPLEKAIDELIFGSKAVGLGQAIRDGLPVPPGVALSGAVVEAVAAGERSAIKACGNMDCAPGSSAGIPLFRRG